jgi:hypothetical protein
MDNRAYVVPSIEKHPTFSGQENLSPAIGQAIQASARSQQGTPIQWQEQGPVSSTDETSARWIGEPREQFFATIPSDATIENRDHHDLGPYEKFGSKSVGLLAISTIFIFAAVSMLSFLWWVDHSNRAWKKIVLHNWLSRTETLCASVIRIAIAYQAALTTSMLAAIVLSQQRPLLHLSASLSVMRFVNTGPRSIVQLFGRDWRTLSHKIWIIGLALTCTTAITQFGSTILISDLHGDLIVGIKEKTYTSSGYRTTIPSWSPQPNYWGIVPQLYPAFAEYSEPGIVQGGIDDTGLTLRSLLPISSEPSRELLHSFQGNATVMDSRVTCVRPSFGGGNLTIQWNSDTLTGQDNSFMSGVVAPAVTVPGLIRRAHDSEATPFKCTFMPTDFQFDDSILWILSICFLNKSAGGLLSELDPYHKTTMTYCFDSHNGWQLATDDGSCPTNRYDYPPDDLSSAVAFYSPPLMGSAYLVLNITRVSFAEFPQQHSSLWSFNDWAFDSNGSMVTAKLSNPGIQFDSTLCYNALNSFDLSITAFSESNRTEPYLGYDISTADFTTESVRSQFGTVSNETFEDRGILLLGSKPQDLQNQVRSFYPLQILGQAPTSFVVGRVSSRLKSNERIVLSALSAHARHARQLYRRCQSSTSVNVSRHMATDWTAGLSSASTFHHTCPDGLLRQPSDIRLFGNSTR